jgi:hypothetical protein
MVTNASCAVKCATPAARNVAPRSGQVARLNAKKPGAALSIAGPTNVQDAQVPKPSAAKMEATTAACTGSGSCCTAPSGISTSTSPDV